MKKLSRRIVLRGIGGATLALPWLEGLSGGKAEAQGQATQKPFAIFVRHGNGVQQKLDGGPLGNEPERFWPTAYGALTDQTLSGRATGELAAWKSKLLVVGNVNNPNINSECGHARGGLQCLTAQPRAAGTSGNTERANGPSIDWRIGADLNPAGNEPLALQARRGPDGYLDFVISYRGANQLRNPIVSPKQAYTQVVGEGGGMSDEGLLLLRDRRKSVNDLVRAQMQRVLANPRLSASDRRRLELHQSNVRDLEVAISTTELDVGDLNALDSEPASSGGNGDTVIALARLHYMVAAFAVASGYTRSVAIQVGNGNDQTQYRINGVTYERFHHISHRANTDGSFNGDAIDNAVMKHHEIDKLFLRTFGYLLERLEQYDMPDGKTLLDHGIALWTNDLNAGPAHWVTNMPYVIAGSAGGQLKQGEYVNGGGVTHNRLLNTIGAAVGVRNGAGGPLDDFGAPDLAKGHIASMLAKPLT